MKNRFLIGVAVLGLLFAQCSPNKSLAPTTDDDKASINLVNRVTPQIVGKWTLRQVEVKLRSGNYYQSELQITKDTVLQNMATLTIQQASQSRLSPSDTRYPEFEGTIEFRGKAYPVYFHLQTLKERLISQQGPQAVLLLNHDAPISPRPAEYDEVYLKKLGLFNTHFSVEVTPNQPTMVWKEYGLTTGLSRIELAKQ